MLTQNNSSHLLISKDSVCNKITVAPGLQASLTQSVPRTSHLKAHHTTGWCPRTQASGLPDGDLTAFARWTTSRVSAFVLWAKARRFVIGQTAGLCSRALSYRVDGLTPCFTQTRSTQHTNLFSGNWQPLLTFHSMQQIRSPTWAQQIWTLEFNRQHVILRKNQGNILLLFDLFTFCIPGWYLH